MKVLITGIGGFAGSHLADYISAHTSDEIFGILRDLEKDDNLRQLDGRVQLSTCEITDFQSTFKVIKEIKPDIIFHVAGQAFVPSSFEHAAETFKTNVIGTINIFEAVKASEISPRIIVVTSGEVYGETFGLPALHTEQSIPQPVNPYAASKTSVDYIAQTYKKYEGLNIVIARPFNHTGPRQKPNFVCSSLAKQIVTLQRSKSPMILRVGNIKARRDFTDVRDIAQGYWMLSQIDNKHNYIFNLCSGRIYSIENIIQLYEEILGVKFELNVEPKRLRGYDIQLLAGNASAINHSVGWKAEIPLKQTLTDLLEYWNHKEI
ncbi:MAG: GDP-mannose 4,6-dehydratase [Bacteriovoracaceae bacterium]|nr:GDP-mannose 4,6-dehydratase [Bacteroidota bacterium]